MWTIYCRLFGVPQGPILGLLNEWKKSKQCHWEVKGDCKKMFEGKRLTDCVWFKMTEMRMIEMATERERERETKKDKLGGIKRQREISTVRKRERDTMK